MTAPLLVYFSNNINICVFIIFVLFYRGNIVHVILSGDQTSHLNAVNTYIYLCKLTFEMKTSSKDYAKSGLLFGVPLFIPLKVTVAARGGNVHIFK
jgi:hypothetical protein